MLISSSVRVPHQRFRSSSASSSACNTARCTAGTSVSVPRNQGSGNLGSGNLGSGNLFSAIRAPPPIRLNRAACSCVDVLSRAFRSYNVGGSSSPRKVGPVAQLDRALRFERRGWEFKSLRVHHFFALDFREPKLLIFTITVSRSLSCKKEFQTQHATL